MAAVMVAGMGVAQTQTTGKPGVVVADVGANPSMKQDVTNRGMGVSIARILDSFKGQIEATVVGSGKFTVLERGELLQAVLDDPARVGDALKLRASDYAMLIKLDNFLCVDEQLGNLVKRRMQISGQVKIVGGVSAEMLSMSNISFEMTDMVSTSLRSVSSMDALLTGVANEFAKRSVEKLLAVKFPMRVIGTSTKDLLSINIGGDFFAEGDRVQVFAPDEIDEDPDTGEKIKIPGGPVGYAKVTNVHAETTQAKPETEFVAPRFARVQRVTKGKDTEK